MMIVVVGAMLGLMPADAGRNHTQDSFLFENDAPPPVIEGTALSLSTVIRPTLGRDRLFIETSTMRKSGAVADAWLLSAYVEPESKSPGETHDGQWLSVRFHCTADTMQPRALAWVNADGRTHGRVNLQMDAKPLGPRDAYHETTVYHYAADIACGRWDWRLGGAGKVSAATAITEVRLPVPPGYQPPLRTPPVPLPASKR